MCEREINGRELNERERERERERKRGREMGIQKSVRER